MYFILVEKSKSPLGEIVPSDDEPDGQYSTAATGKWLFMLTVSCNLNLSLTYINL